MEFHILLRVEQSVTHVLSCLIIHKNNCTYDSSSKVHLFARFNVWILFCFCFYKEKGKGRTPPIRQVFYKHVVLYCFSFLSCCLFFGSHHGFLGWVTEPNYHPKYATSCSHAGSQTSLLLRQLQSYCRVLTIFFQYYIYIYAHFQHR